MSREAFIEQHSTIYEHSRWVAERVMRQPRTFTHVNELIEAMKAVVDDAPLVERYELIRAHPDLAGRAQLRGELTADSTDEQASAGLDQCSAEELADFQSLNAQYKDKFGFPFIMAVRNSTRQDILAAFRKRLLNDEDTEFNTAMTEVHKIAALRLQHLYPDGLINA